MTPTVVPGTNPGAVSSALPEPPAQEKKARVRERLLKGKVGGKSLRKSSVTPPIESATNHFKQKRHEDP